MRRWEYRSEIHAFNNFMDPATPNNPNALGAQGWELVGLEGMGDNYKLHLWGIYKREIYTPKDERNIHGYKDQ